MTITATVYRDGKSIRTTTLSAADAEKFAALAAAVRAGQSLLKAKPNQSGEQSRAGVANSQSTHSDCYAALSQLDALTGADVNTPPYPWVENASQEVLRNPDGTPAHGLRPKWKNAVPQPPKNDALRLMFPAGDYTTQASVLGMVPADLLAFDRAELTDDAPPRSGSRQINAFIRWSAL